MASWQIAIVLLTAVAIAVGPILLSWRRDNTWFCAACGGRDYRCHSFGADVLVCQDCGYTEGA